MKMNKDVFEKITRGVCKIFVYGSLTLLSMKLNNEFKRARYDDYIDHESYNGAMTYSDAVDSIINSRMLSNYKQAALKMVKRDMDAEYYSAIASIVNGSDLDNYKLNMIRTLYDEAQAE